MNKIILVKGIQGSGKTTWSKNWAKEDPLHRIRLNYDDIRNMLGKYWVPEREQLVRYIFQRSLLEAMNLGYDIVIDNFNNLNPTHQVEYKRMTDFYNHNRLSHMYIIEDKVFNTPLETCIERDSKRENPIGEKVITEAYDKYKKQLGYE